MIDNQKKKKGKAHPFEGMLRDDEKIVWMSTPSRPSLWRMFKHSLWIYQIIFLFLISIFLVYPRSFNVERHQWPTLFIAVIGIETGIVLVVITLVWLFRLYHRHERFYAITNQRVLYSIKGLKRSIPLKALPYIDIFSIDRGGRWNAYHPMWLTLDDAKRVVQLMEETKHRLEKADPIAGEPS